MIPCNFCADKPIKIVETPAWFIGLPAITGPFKYSVSVPISNVSDFRTDTRFTPEARLTLDMSGASQLSGHRIAWASFIKTGAHHGLILEDSYLANNPSNIQSLETIEIPRDWDILLLSDTQYLLTQRAASILHSSTSQFHHNLSRLLRTHPLLKSVNASLNKNSPPSNE